MAIVFGCVAGFLLGEIVASVLVDVAAQADHFPGGLTAITKLASPPWWSNLLGLVGLWIGFGASIGFARTRGELSDLPGQWSFRTTDVAYVALGIGVQLLVDLAYSPFHFKGLNKPVNHLFGGASGFTFVLLAVMTTLGAPIVEEWFFRGVLFRAFDEGLSVTLRRGGTVVAALVSACLFALAHGEPLQFVGLAVLGFILAILVKRTQRLVPSIITHASFNAVALVSLVHQRAGH
ncbi:MAG: CPBP family glutamic-type intramembrane protease [Acidimicrobiales bacterium]